MCIARGECKSLIGYCLLGFCNDHTLRGEPACRRRVLSIDLLSHPGMDKNLRKTDKRIDIMISGDEIEV